MMNHDEGKVDDIDASPVAGAAAAAASSDAEGWDNMAAPETNQTD